MTSLTPKERLLRALRREAVDRPPVICIGGMMNAAIVEIMKETGHTLPQAHFDDGLMADLAADVQEFTGFENLGVPFCMTVEAEALGSRIDFGSLSCEPKIAAEAFPSVSRFVFPGLSGLNGTGRLKTVMKASARLREAYPNVPLVASLTGPISTAASLVDPMTFLKELRKNREGSHRVLKHVTDFLGLYAEKLYDSGADVIGIGDPTATGEILGPAMFEEYAVPYLNQLIDHVHVLGAPVIVHICGRMNKVRHLIPRLRGDAVSTDAMVNLRRLKEDFPRLTTMGNLSTYLLEFGTPAKVAHRTETLVARGIDIISPACGLSTSTPLENIRALTLTVKGIPAC